jgi:hypothetical protein
LETAFEYRHAVEQSLCELNEMCGLPDISNVKQCVRKIASRLQKANLVGAVTIRNQSDVSLMINNSLTDDLIILFFRYLYLNILQHYRNYLVKVLLLWKKYVE